LGLIEYLGPEVGIGHIQGGICVRAVELRFGKTELCNALTVFRRVLDLHNSAATG
jgi:hypothetical protein